MILSDRSIRNELKSGRIVIEPFDDTCVQPSSVDLHVDRFFRVFRNDTTPYIDPKQPQEDLTELVEVKDGGAFILHPGEFVLGSTLERVALPSDLVARLEGKSSLGRLGLLIHSSLPASETVFVLHDGRLAPWRIGDIVSKHLHAQVVAFDPATGAVDFATITGWYEGPADHIYEVELASGRRVRVTAGHNLFTRAADGSIAKVRTGELAPGIKVAVPARVPAPPVRTNTVDLLDFVPESTYADLVCEGPSVLALRTERRSAVMRALHDSGYDSNDRRGRLPLAMALDICGGRDALSDFRIARADLQSSVARRLAFDTTLAHALGRYIGHGTIETLARALGCSRGLALLVAGWLGADPASRAARVPSIVFGFTDDVIDAFLAGARRHDPMTGDLLVLAAGRVSDVGECGDLVWDDVVTVHDTGVTEPIYDLEVRPEGRRIENFLAGSGGVFVSNTAGFIDAGWDGHLTLELSNVATLPIAIYPGMKIGQISFLQMTEAAEEPYGSKAVGSKYQGQRGPTPSRYYLNFKDEED